MPAIARPADRRHGRSQVLDPAGLLQRAELARHVVPEGRPARIHRSVRAQRVGIGGRPAGLVEPAREMRLVARQQAHLGRGHVDAKHRIGGVVGEPGSKLRARFDDQDPHVRKGHGGGEMIGDRSTREPSAHDRDGRRCPVSRALPAGTVDVGASIGSSGLDGGHGDLPMRTAGCGPRALSPRPGMETRSTIRSIKAINLVDNSGSDGPISLPEGTGERLSAPPIVLLNVEPFR